MIEAKLYGLITSRRKEGIFGILYDWDKKEFATFLTRSFGADNQVLVDVGEHSCVRSFYYRGRYSTFEIIVPGHTEIKFHMLNWANQSKGCVGIGESFDIIEGLEGIGGSSHGFNEFWAKYGHFREFTFIVREFVWT